MFSIVKNKKSKNIVMLLSLVLGSLLSIHGLLQFDWAHSFPFTSENVFYKYIAFLFSAVVVGFFCLKYRKQNIFKIAAILYLSVAIISGTVWPILVTIWFAFASLILGKGISILLGMKEKGGIWLIDLIVGAGVYGTIVGLLIHFPISYPGLYAAGLALPLLVGWSTFSTICQEIKVSFNGQNNEGTQIDWLGLSIVVVSLIHYVTAFMPEISYDALAVHLFIPSHVASNHQWGFDAELYSLGLVPLLADWIYTIGYMLGGETASRLFNVGFIFITCRLLYDLVLWVGGNEAGAKWAVLLILSTPLTYTESSGLFIESIWAVFIVSGVFSFLKVCSNDKNSNQYILISGLLLGLALASKLITVTVFPALLCIFIIKYKKWLSIEVINKLLSGLILFLAVASIPYITAWVITNNPVFPFYNGLFKSEYYHLSNFNNPLYNSPIRWKSLYDITFNTSNYLEAGPGAAGFQWLVLLVPSALLLLFIQHMRALVIFFVGILTVIVVFQFQSYLRYIFPSVVFLMVVIGLFLSYVSVEHVKIYRLVVVISSLVVCVNLVFIFSGSPYRDFPLLSILDKSLREDYLELRRPTRNAVNLVNELNKNASPVAFFTHPYAAGLKADALHPRWYNNRFQRLIMQTNSEQAFVTLLEKEGIQFLILNENWGDTKKRRLIKRLTDEVQNFGRGSVSVRTIRTEVRELLKLNSELLLNNDFSSSDGWNFPNDTRRGPNGGVIVSVAFPVTQTVPVNPGKGYLKSIKAYCPQEATQGRLQINWSDLDYKYVSAEIRVFDCSDLLEEHTMSVVAPTNAAYATIYGGSHTDSSIIVKDIRFNAE